MRKYYYYVFSFDENKVGNCVCYSDDGKFPLIKSIKYINELLDTDCVITFWDEISSAVYDEFYKKYK